MKGVIGNLINKDSVIFHYLDYEKLHMQYPEIKEGYKGERANELWRLVVLGQYLENFKAYIKYT